MIACSFPFTWCFVVFSDANFYTSPISVLVGWAATVKFNEVVAAQFAAFRERKDTFSFGVCNGCQLMGLLGWVAPDVGKYRDL